MTNPNDEVQAAAGSAATEEVAVFGGGCFWCTEAVFQQLRGVRSVMPGYAGGHVDQPTYEAVCAGDTGHVEVIEVRYDPAQIRYTDLLNVFFATHDPTSRDRQGHDVGPQYRSAVFCQSEAQREAAQHTIDALNRTGVFDAPIVTQLYGADHFWPAETYHRDYFVRNPRQGYCHAVISPKVAKFRKQFVDYLRA
ncbi:peptide-methionine (S)-S-oxide reductase MsrA [Verticiella sediminum]|uniref:Peptide methionine sulfoxide reductase MsrA n=1 Tax=Verticiella sediminum TaxID=1247510 RepID=A0A556AMV9_9BURK|nr:peptide-methionine (S)-S-oxide reductase MsrA [Verticiella sediminum]TSH94205.1 peptide-methionine (S)-S-oxide reductase MsrA [Verticiella sediminum]